ncbi:hypothetical protein RvY_11123 [Ramazzottius varieornatus]|uniref:Uncharacterized protein n=1 Tax=Ramazzottius varieornatus TaxID=947166 RepID=A0A1D1VH45_RAMVA|nr:hypothetical protein RvY_11123 [Ramazzottius varieornatus]
MAKVDGSKGQSQMGRDQRRATLARSAGKVAASQPPSSAKAAKSASSSHVSPSESAAKTLASGIREFWYIL